MKKTIKPLVGNELSYVVDYFLNLTPTDDERMGTDRKNLPSRTEWIKLLVDDSNKPLHERQFYYLGFFLEDRPVGHSGINKIKFGEEACIHLHIWLPELRQQGLGSVYFQEAVKYYFNHFHFKKIICEPHINNPGPNRTLLKCGFKFYRKYRTKPSILSIEHEVNRYEILRPVDLL